MTDPTDENQPPPQPQQPEPVAPEQPEPVAPEQPEPVAPEQPAAETPPPVEDATERIQALREKAADAFKTGADDARDAFEKQFPKAKEDIAKGVNDASYAIGYAISFGSTLIREFSPDNVSEGFERGSQAGSKAAEEVIENRTARSADPPEDVDPTTPGNAS